MPQHAIGAPIRVKKMPQKLKKSHCGTTTGIIFATVYAPPVGPRGSAGQIPLFRCRGTLIQLRQKKKEIRRMQEQLGAEEAQVDEAIAWLEEEFRPAVLSELLELPLKDLMHLKEERAEEEGEEADCVTAKEEDDNMEEDLVEEEDVIEEDQQAGHRNDANHDPFGQQVTIARVPELPSQAEVARIKDRKRSRMEEQEEEKKYRKRIWWNVEEWPEEKIQEEEDVIEEEIKDAEEQEENMDADIEACWHERRLEEGNVNEPQGDGAAQYYASQWLAPDGDYSIPEQYTPCVYFFTGRHGCQNEACPFSHNTEIFDEEPYAAFLKSLPSISSSSSSSPPPGEDGGEDPHVTTEEAQTSGASGG